MSRYIIICIIGLTCLWSCKPTIPSEYIQPDEMEDLLVDFHMSRAMAQLDGSFEEQSYKKQLYWQAALEKHGVTQEQFDSSLVYYYIRADRFDNIYQRVLNRLQDDALALGASEGDIGRFTSYDENGDTANIWRRNSALVMTPVAPYHRVEFSIQGDSLFRPGDTFFMQFMSDFIYQTGKKDGLLYLAIEYPDSIVVRQTRFSYSGLNQLNVKVDEKVGCPKRVYGYFYLGGADDPSTTIRLLFVNNIQLIRFHTTAIINNDETEQQSQTDSISSGTIARRDADESNGGGNTSGNGAKVLPANRGASPNRMVERIDSLKSRR